jgi:rhamnosyltransferase
MNSATRDPLPTVPGAAGASNANICAVMVVYNPDSTLAQNIRTLRDEVASLIVVDNGSEPASRQGTAALAGACNFELIWNDKNLGLAVGLNAGIRRALAREDHRWIATFDQDSQVSPGFSRAMLEAYDRCPFRDQVALVGPRHLLLAGPATYRSSPDQSSPLFLERPVMLQSGSMFSRSAFASAGLFDESFFIDYVDFEFCLRLRKKGLRIIEATHAVLWHRVGAPSSHTILGKTCVVYNHSPVRRYYAARNRFRVYWRYFRSDPRWIAHDIWSWFKEIIKMFLFEEKPLQKLAHMAKGGWDACRGRSGSYQGALSQRS